MTLGRLRRELATLVQQEVLLAVEGGISPEQARIDAGLSREEIKRLFRAQEPTPGPVMIRAYLVNLQASITAATNAYQYARRIWNRTQREE